MINVSSNFKEELNNGNRNYICNVDIELQDEDSTVLNLDNKDIWSGGISIEESVSNDTSFDVGSTIINKATVVINNIYENYSEYDFTGAKVTIKVGLNLSGGTTEMVNKGIFYVDEAKYNGGILTLECLDSMSRFDKDYDTTLQFPATLQQIVQDACTNCGVLYSAAGFSGSDYIIQTKPDTSSLTYRQILSYVGQIACQQFSIDHNDRLVARWYNLTTMDSLHNNNSAIDESDYHHISSISTSNIDIDDVVITGVRVTEYSEDSENPGGVYTSGSDGYIIEIKDNRLIAVGSGNTVASMIGDRLIGARFRPMTITFQSDPTIEPTDIVEIIDYKGNHYYTFVTHTSFTVGSLQTLKCSAKSALRNSASRYSSATQAYNSSRVLIEKERTQREAAIQALNNALKNSSGMYITEEKQADGSTITYLHDKPTLSDSQNVIKITAEAIGISNDGGATYPYGLFLTGDLIARLLYVVGINADYINTGAIHVEDNDGNIVFHVDMDTKQVIISGDSVRIGSKTATTAISDAIQESKDYSDGKLADFADTITEDLTNIQAQVDGQIETYYEDYEPSLQNYPANEWTTTEDRKKHEGDLFYWKSKGYAYRFFQDGATWKWQLVQDTDITQAMAAAEQAQDTADGKRRVFVVTPQPPYDIGDLWCNGEDILTCSTARAQGSVYVSTDWTKLNTYTDDTVANQALEEARQARNLNMILDNEYQGIPADYEGNISSFPAVKTGVQVLYGHTDVSANCSYSTTKSDSITGNWNNTLRVYTVTGLSSDSGWVDITASYLTLFTVTKRFNIQKIKDGAPGQDGANGTDGIGVSNSSVTYQASSSGTTIPTGTWQTSIPSVSPGQYLWTRTQFTYSNETNSYTYSVSRMGTNGQDGSDGQNGSDGRGVQSTEVEYQASSSGTTAPTGTWQSNVPSVEEGQYLWTRTTITYTDDTTSIAYSVSRMGVDGTDGLPGQDGQDGRTSYFHVKYSSVANPTTSSQMTETPSAYIGTYVDFTQADSNDPSDYTWARFQGYDGQDGADGIPGTNGENGQTSYLHIAYANSSDGTDGFSVTDGTNKLYIGQYADFTQADSTNPSDYTWSKIKGDQGDPGEDGKIYQIEPSDVLIKIAEDRIMKPDHLLFNAYVREGDSARRPYSGRFIIEESADGQSWSTIYQSPSDESSVKRYLYGAISNAAGSVITNANGNAIGALRNFSEVRATLYAAGGFTTIVDRVTIPVITAVESLDQKDIFNLLTNNGLAKGVYMIGNELYINATYLATGILTDLLGRNYWNLNTGEFALSPSTTVGGETVQEIADSAAGSAVDAMSQADVFNKLTNNGALPGIFMQNGQLYVNANYIGAGTLLADYIKGGTLTLGGSNNTNGILQILNASGHQIGKWDKDGINASNADISGKVSASEGQIGNWQISGGNLTNGLPYTGEQNSNATGMGDYGGGWAFWAGNGKFSVEQSGKLRASDAEISGSVNANSGIFNGTVNADSGVFNNITVQNSSVYSSYMAGTAGTISGGTYSSPYISGGTLGSPGGTYVGTCSGSTLNSCSIGSTSLSSGNGYIQSDFAGVNIHSSGGVLLWRGSLNAGYTYAGWQVAGNMYCSGNLSCGGSKPRTMRTKNFGERQLDAMESTEPAFSDFGKAVLNENGEFYVFLDPILAECVSPDSIPLVFLTKYGQGDIWVDDERTNHEVAVICGTPGLKFTWETRYMQGNGYQDRLRIRDFDDPYITDEDYLGDTNNEIAQNTVDYESMADDYATVCNAEAESYAVAGYVYFTQYESQAENYAAIGAKYYEDFERSLLGI